MKKRLLLFLLPVLSLMVSGQSNADAGKTQLTEAMKAYGLSALCTEVKYNFVYYDQLAFDWDSLCMASLPAVLATKTEYEYFRALQRICAMLGDGHTSVFKIRIDDVADRVGPLPFEAQLFDKRIFVNKTLSKALQNKGLDKGAEIIKINGNDAYTYGIEKVMPYISSSTPQWSYYRTFLSKLTEGRKDQPMTVVYKDRNGKTHTESFDKRTLEWDIEDNRETFIFNTLAGNTGYLQIGNFTDNDFVGKFDKIYDELKDTRALIIDLRNNGGGNSGYADYILRHLSEKPFKSSQWSTRMYLPAHASWQFPDEWYVSAPYNMHPVNKEIYTKPVLLLINEGTYSSAEDFCIKFQGMKRGPVVGKPSGGSTGNPIGKILLEEVVGVQICTKKDVGPDGTPYVGIGIIPDIESESTLDDFLSGKDAVLETALLYLDK